MVVGFPSFQFEFRESLFPGIKKLFQQAEIVNKESRTQEDVIQEIRQQGWQEVKVHDLTELELEVFTSFLGRRSKKLRFGLRLKLVGSKF